MLFSFQHKSCANLAGFLGVNLCGHVSLPMAYRDYDSPYFPLSGDSSFGMSFHTINPRLARFEVETRTLRSEDENRFDWIFNVHVPGLTFGRKVVGNSTFQFLEDGKYLSVSWGIQDYKFGKFEAKYNNVSNRLQTKFSTPRMAYLRPITVETEVSIYSKRLCYQYKKKCGVYIPHHRKLSNLLNKCTENYGRIFGII